MTVSALPFVFDATSKPTGFSTGDASIEYNGFKFPPAFRATAQVMPVMDNSNRISKYTQLEIKVSCYIFHGLNLGATGTVASPATGTNLYSGNFNPTANWPAANVSGPQDVTFTTDLEMDNIRSRLTEPCQKLVFKSQGLGTVLVNDPATVATYDVDNGPKPKMVTWRPIGSHCCFIEWEVIARISPCATDQRSIAQFPFSVSFGINRAGTTTRTITGEVEIALTRVANTSDAHAGVSSPFYLAATRDVILIAFPLMPGFHRDQDYLVSEDRKHVQFTIVDTEIGSDEAYGEGCLDEDVTLSTNNSEAMVFSIWDVSLSGSIELIAGYPKRYALAEISRLFHRYFTYCAYTGDRLYRKGTDDPANEGENSDSDTAFLAKVTNGSYPILQTLSFTDHLFARKIDFSIGWKLFTSLQTLFTATGMFVPARNYTAYDPDNPTNPQIPLDNPSEAQNTAWGLWKTSLGVFANAGGFQSLDFSDADDIIVSLCQDAVGGGQTPNALNTQFEPIPESSNENDSDERTATDAWHSFEPRFELERIEHTTYHQPLANYASLSEETKAPDVARETEDFTPNIPYQTEGISDTQNFVHARRDPAFLLHFSGYAIRMNLPVPEPNVKSYGDWLNPDTGIQEPMPIYRIGKSILKPRLIGQGTDLVTGKSYKIYGLQWRKTYALPSVPLSAKIGTDAHKDIYVG